MRITIHIVNTIRKNQLIGVVGTLAAAAAVHDTLAAVHSDRGVVDVFIVEIKFYQSDVIFCDRELKVSANSFRPPAGAPTFTLKNVFEILLLNPSLNLNSESPR